MLRRCKEPHGKQKILKNADSNQRNRLGIQKLRWKRSKMSINETGCATHPVMRQVSRVWTGCARHLMMRHASGIHSIKENSYYWMHHASGDAPRIKGTSSTELFRKQLLLDAPCILWCATHQVKSTAGNALNDKLYSDAPRIETSHFQNIKGIEGSYFQSLSPFFPFRTDRQNSSRGLSKPFSAHLGGIEVVRSCSSSSESTITCFLRRFEGKRAADLGFRLKSVF